MIRIVRLAASRLVGGVPGRYEACLLAPPSAPLPSRHTEPQVACRKRRLSWVTLMAERYFDLLLLALCRCISAFGATRQTLPCILTTLHRRRRLASQALPTVPSQSPRVHRFMSSGSVNVSEIRSLRSSSDAPSIDVLSIPMSFTLALCTSLPFDACRKGLLPGHSVCKSCCETYIG